MANSRLVYPTPFKKPGKTKAFFICLVIAAFVWLFHSLNTVYTYSFKIPVTFKNLPQNKKPLVQIPEKLTVDVKASGLKLSLILLRKPLPELEIDFNTLKASNRNQNFVLSASNINFRRVFKFETAIKHISPDTLYFSDKTGVQKNIPVKTNVFLKCKEGYAFKRAIVNPEFISIWGDTSVIRSIDTIYSAPVYMNHVDQNINKTVELIKPHPNVYTSSNDVQVFFEVAKLVEQSLYLRVNDVRQNVNQKIHIYPSSVKVTFTAIQNAFSPSDTAMFKVMIDSKRLNKQSKKYPVFLSTVPGHVTIMSIEPKEVEALIFIQQ